MNKDEWSKQMCEMHLLEAKVKIANILHESFTEAGKGLENVEFPEFANRQTLRTNIGMQLLSVCFELTEDLAATCFSYAKAIKNNNKNVPEYLRDFGDQKKKPEEAGTPTVFYKTASDDICYSAEMIGIDPIADVSTAVVHQKFFKVVRDFRKEYDDWYQGYKHGQRTLPMYVWSGTPQPKKENVKFVVYRIPQALQEKGDKVFVEEDFLDMINEEEKFFKLINDIFGVWQGVKQRQFVKVFPPVPAITPQPVSA